MPQPTLKDDAPTQDLTLRLQRAVDQLRKRGISDAHFGGNSEFGATSAFLKGGQLTIVAADRTSFPHFMEDLVSVIEGYLQGKFKPLKPAQDSTLKSKHTRARQEAQDMLRRGLALQAEQNLLGSKPQAERQGIEIDRSKPPVKVAQ